MVCNREGWYRSAINYGKGVGMRMILADKIIDERKKNGWSQEELADKLGVSRQSVSKWEGAQSVPDLQRILDMSKLFGVSTDYLLKDDAEARPVSEASEDTDSAMRRVSMEEANAFLGENGKFAVKIATGVLLSTMCPVPLLLLEAAKEAGLFGITDGIAGGVGMVLLLVLIAISLVFFIPAGIAASKWEWLEKEIFDTEYGVDGMVKDRAEKFQPKFVKAITAGTVLILLGVIGVVASAIVEGHGEGLTIGLVAVLLACIAIACFMIVNAGIIKDGFSKLLQEGDYNKTNKTNYVLKAVAPAYWLTVTAGYLLWSFLTMNWGFTWIVWPVAGVLYGAIAVVLSGVHEAKNK